MERAPDGRILVVADTSFLLNFVHVDRLDLLHGLRAYAFRVPADVVAEVRVGEERRRMRRGFEDGTLSDVEIVDPVEIALYQGFRRYLGDGESACLAVAAHRRWVIAADEKRRLRREIFGRLGEAYLLNTAGAFVLTLRAGLLSVDEAERLRAELARHRFVMDVPSFEELLGEG